MACTFFFEEQGHFSCHCSEKYVGGKVIFHKPSEEEISRYCNGGILENDKCPHMIELLKWGEGRGVMPFGAGSPSDFGIDDGP